MTTVDVSIPDKLVRKIRRCYPGAKLEFREVEEGEFYYSHVEGILRPAGGGATPYGPRLVVVVPEPKTFTLWVNVYPSEGLRSVFHTREGADVHASKGRIACVPAEVKYTPGEGLES